MRTKQGEHRGRPGTAAGERCDEHPGESRPRRLFRKCHIRYCDTVARATGSEKQREHVKLAKERDDSAEAVGDPLR